MKPTLPLTVAALIHLLACSAGTEDSPLPGASAGSAGVSATPGVGGATAGGASAGAPSGGVTTGGSPTQLGGSGGLPTGTSGSGGGAAFAGSGGVGGGPVSGASLYEANCFSCHLPEGVGGVLAPEIQHPVRDYSTWVVRHGLPGMGFVKPMAIVGPDKLSDADLTLIWDFLDQPPQPTTGQALYHDYCANCHGADGKGGPTMRNITNELAKLKTQVRMGSKLGQFQLRHDFMPAFPTSRLSDSEVDLIYAYVDSL